MVDGSGRHRRSDRFYRELQVGGSIFRIQFSKFNKNAVAFLFKNESFLQLIDSKDSSVIFKKNN
jgi:hypothetical protein